MAESRDTETKRWRALLTVGVGLSVIASLLAAGVGTVAADPTTNESVSEEAYLEPAPEEGDPYYEASNGEWVSYDNPRDEYRSPYLGDGSGKIGVTLLNEAGEPIVGETVPNTTITIPTGETTSWHSQADPVTVDLPLTEHYDRPLDGDQFGTTDDLPQGDGYMDSHTIEMHGHPEDATIEYGEAQIEGEHADDIEVVGYIQQAHDTWNTDIDPLEAAESYEEAGGGWTYYPGGSHGQVIVVLQLDREGYDGEPADGGENGTENESGTENANESPNGGNESPVESQPNESDGDESDDEMPGFGGLAVIVALGASAFVAARQAG